MQRVGGNKVCSFGSWELTCFIEELGSDTFGHSGGENEKSRDFYHHLLARKAARNWGQSLNRDLFDGFASK